MHIKHELEMRGKIVKGGSPFEEAYTYRRGTSNSKPLEFEFKL